MVSVHYIDDFKKSDAPQFKGKSDKKNRYGNCRCLMQKTKKKKLNLMK